jgi:broad specificity phosphatase PhoE
VTRILIVRHGHVAWHNPERFRGRADLALSDLGRRQAERAAWQIAALCRPDAVYTSPLARCVATADAIAAPFGLVPQPEPGLVDIDYGQWQGLTRDEAAARWPEEAALWFRLPHLAAIPGGESLAALAARTTTALRDILRRHAEGAIVVVGHDSVNRVLLLFSLGLPLSRYWHLEQSPCGIDDLACENGEFFVRTVNETQHLAGL